MLLVMIASVVVAIAIIVAAVFWSSRRSQHGYSTGTSRHSSFIDIGAISGTGYRIRTASGRYISANDGRRGGNYRSGRKRS